MVSPRQAALYILGAALGLVLYRAATALASRTGWGLKGAVLIQAAE